MDRSVAFYRDVLGLTLTFQSPHWSGFDLGGIRLGLHPPFAAGSVHPSPTWIVALATSQVANLRAKLIEAGVEVSPYHEIPDGVSFNFADPDGNPLQAMQRGIRRADLPE